MRNHTSRPSHDWPALVLFLVVLLVSDRAPARSTDELVVAVARAPLSLPVYVAQARGYFKEEGVSVRIADCETGRECLDRMFSGAAHVATAADSAIVFASLQRERFAVLATMATARHYHKIITRRDSGLASLADLRGARVGTVVGTSAQYFLDLSLMISQVEPSRVIIVPLKPSEAASALDQGDVDAVAIFEPYAHQTVRLLGPRAHVLAGAPFRRVTWNLVAADSTVRDRKAMLGRLCRALARAEEFIATDPATARSILRHSLALDPQTIDWVWSDLGFRMQLSQSLVASLEGQARWAIHSGYAPGPATNYLDYIRQDVLSDAIPGAAAIAR
jgi:NitT/TauT family transport system substrate-binding protein